MVMLFIRSASSEEGCKYVIMDGETVVKKLYEEDEPVDFDREVESLREKKEKDKLLKNIDDLKSQNANIMLIMARNNLK
jgi:hypothetical protein